MNESTGEYDAIDFFRGNELVADPYPYFDWLRSQCPVRPESQHQVYMVTGLRRGMRRLRGHRDLLLVQRGDRTLPWVSGSARG